MRCDWWAAILSTLHLNLSSLPGLVAALLLLHLTKQQQFRNKTIARQVDMRQRGGDQIHDCNRSPVVILPGTKGTLAAWRKVPEAVRIAAGHAALAWVGYGIAALPLFGFKREVDAMTIPAAALLSVFAQGVEALLLYILAIVRATVAATTREIFRCSHYTL